MTGLLPIRSLNSVMVVTLHVAVVSCILRSLLGATGPAGPSVVVWVPLTILVSLFLSLPMGHAVAGAFRSGEETPGRACSRCRLGELRPLRRVGAGLFAPISGYRCAGCGTTYREVGETIVEEAPWAPSASADPEGVAFLQGTSEADAVDPGIRFLDDPKPS